MSKPAMQEDTRNQNSGLATELLPKAPKTKSNFLELLSCSWFGRKNRKTMQNPTVSCSPLLFSYEVNKSNKATQKACCCFHDHNQCPARRQSLLHRGPFWRRPWCQTAIAQQAARRNLGPACAKAASRSLGRSWAKSGSNGMPKNQPPPTLAWPCQDYGRDQ